MEGITEFTKNTLDFLVTEKRIDMGSFCLDNLKIERVHEYIRNELLYSLHTLIPAENMKEETHTVTVEYPETWWEAFKEQYFKGWLKTWFPVKYRTKTETVTFTAYNLYPMFPDFAPECCIDSVQIICKSGE